MTHFKRILNECHQLIVTEKLDQEATEKATELKGLIERLSSLETDLAEASSFCFDKVDAALKDGFGSISNMKE